MKNQLIKYTKKIPKNKIINYEKRQIFKIKKKKKK